MYFMWQIEKRIVFELSQRYWWELLLCIEKNGELVQTLDCHTG